MKRRAIKIASSVEGQGAIRVVPVLTIVLESMQNLLGPASTRDGRQFEHNAAAIASWTTAGDTSEICCAVQISSGVEDERGCRIIPVLTAAGEAVQDGFLLGCGAAGRCK